jgi:hypothetical protein
MRGDFSMSNSVSKPAGVVGAPALAPVGLNDVLEHAEALLALMGRESLRAVAELADVLRRSAHEAGAAEIEAAANEVHRVASGQGPVALAGAMRALAEAIARSESLVEA